MSKLIQNYVNHIVFVIDGSGSMEHLEGEVVDVFDAQIAHLAKRSKELDQETRVSVYIFNEMVRCLIYDMDVMRLPSLKAHYDADGATALIDGTLKAIEDLEKTPELYGDHAFLLYIMTDGEENRSRHRPLELTLKLDAFKDNWTAAVLVPNKYGVHEAKKFGFPAENIQIWSAEIGGVEAAGERIKDATENFMQNRAKGVRGTKKLFSVDASKLSTTQVKRNLIELKEGKDYDIIPVRIAKGKKVQIKDYVEDFLEITYRTGSAYYELTKKEIIQAAKEICVQEKRNGKVYSGANARQMLGLPDTEIRVEPANFGEFKIFVQSTSVNRHLVDGTQLIVLR